MVKTCLQDHYTCKLSNTDNKKYYRGYSKQNFFQYTFILKHLLEGVEERILLLISVFQNFMKR